MKKLNSNYIEHHNRCYGDNHSSSKFIGMGRHLILLLIAMLMALAFTALAQEGAVESEPVSEKMKYFHFMEGQWEGLAQHSNRDGSKTLIHQHENIQIKLDGTLILAEGTGKDDEGTVVFNAVATIYYDQASDSFKMMAFRDNGQNTLADIEVKGDAHFIWSFSPGENTHIKYETRVKDGVWSENGFFSRDGQNWMPTFAMEVKKVDHSD